MDPRSEPIVHMPVDSLLDQQTMNNDTNTHQANSTVSSATGMAGLDDILYGGLTPNRLYLIEGVPGSGKTTLAMRYLLEGAKAGEPVLYVTLSETEEELRAMAD